MEIGATYYWKHDSETKLEYLGCNWSGNGFWHQFALIGDEQKKVWCEVLNSDLHLIERFLSA